MSSTPAPHTISLVPTAGAGAEARRWVESVTETLSRPVVDDVRRDTELVVTELGTNAVKVARSAVLLSLREVGTLLHVEVMDDDVTHAPTPRDARPDESRGRGLMLVSALSVDWGWFGGDADAKTVWATIRLWPS